MTAADPQDQPAPSVRITLPPDLVGGVYANFLLAWHSGHEFTLDFAATQPVEPPAAGEEGAGPVVPCQIVARVKVPPTVLFDMLRAMSDNLATYERTYGSIRRPEQPNPGAEQ